MRWAVRPIVVVGCGVAAGCTSSTGILPAGPDTYTLTERADFRDEAQRAALTKANEYCATQGRQFVPSTMGPSGPAYTVTFRCLAPNDPAVAAYRLQRAPNVIIEQRNQ
jgi:hypothetical protein